MPVEVASVAVSPGNLPRGPLDLSTPIIKAQEDIGSCSKCRKSSVAGRILRRTRTGRRGGLGRQAKTRAPRDLRVGEGSSCLQHDAYNVRAPTYNAWVIFYLDQLLSC